MRTTLPIAHTLRGQPPRSRPWRSRRLAVLCSCIGVFVLVMSLAGLVSYQEYHRDMTLAQDGVQHLQTAQRLMKNLTQGSLDAHIVLQARQEFAKAFSAFGQIKNDLEQVPGVATAVPRYGSLLSTALQIVPVAVELSQAGMTGCDVLTLVIPRLRESLDAKGPGITMEDLIIVTHDVAQIQALLNIATGQISRLQPSDLQIDPRIGSAIATLRTALPGLQMGLLQARTLLSITPTLLGIDKPTSYLIEQLDSTQLRLVEATSAAMALSPFQGDGYQAFICLIRTSSMTLINMLAIVFLIHQHTRGLATTSHQRAGACMIPILMLIFRQQHAMPNKFIIPKGAQIPSKA